MEGTPPFFPFPIYRLVSTAISLYFQEPRKIRGNTPNQMYNMKWTGQIWMSSFLEFEMESDTQPTELEIIQAYEKLQESDNPQVEYRESIDQTDSHENEVQND